MLKDNVANAFYLESIIFMWNSLDKAAFNYVLVFAFILFLWNGVTNPSLDLDQPFMVGAPLGLFLVCILFVW